MRVEEGGKAQAHGQASELAGQLHAGEGHTHGEAKCQSDQQLLRQDQQSGQRHRIDPSNRRYRRRDDQRQHEAQAKLDRYRHTDIAEQRCGGQQPENARQRPQQAGNQRVELGTGEGNHRLKNLS